MALTSGFWYRSDQSCDLSVISLPKIGSRRSRYNRF